MRRKHNGWWEVFADDFWYCGSKRGWKKDPDPKVRSYNICSCKTKSKALKQARRLNALGADDITVSQITYLHGVRLFLDYKFNP
jgi:hypothetical protein